jgi:hypothetical protein
MYKLKHLIRFIDEEGNSEDHLVTKYDYELRVQPLPPPIISSLSGNFVPATIFYNGFFRVMNITDVALMSFLLGRPKIFRVKIYDDIFSFDEDDLEMALNVRAVHKSPYPDYELDDCVVERHEFTEINDFYNDRKLPLIESMNFIFNSLTTH